MALTPPGREKGCSLERFIAFLTRKGHKIVRHGAERAGLHKDSDKGAPNPTHLGTKNTAA
jgi:hypothetical protein